MLFDKLFQLPESSTIRMAEKQRIRFSASFVYIYSR